MKPSVDLKKEWMDYFERYGRPTKNIYGDNFTDTEDFDDFIFGLLHTIKMMQERIDDLENKVRIEEQNGQVK